VASRSPDDILTQTEFTSLPVLIILFLGNRCVARNINPDNGTWR
jgi:hypothetical protein